MKKTILEIICYFIFALFIYAAFSKILAFSIYTYDLQRSAYIGKFYGLLSYTLPVIELGIAITVLIPRTRHKALLASAVVMFLFTIYVGIALRTVAYEPCTCGALIRELSWSQHLWFNIFFIGLSVAGIFIQRKIGKEKPENIKESWKPSF